MRGHHTSNIIWANYHMGKTFDSRRKIGISLTSVIFQKRTNNWIIGIGTTQVPQGCYDLKFFQLWTSSKCHSHVWRPNYLPLRRSSEGPVLTDSSTHTLKIPPMNVTTVTDHCSAKCYKQWGQKLSKTSSDHNLFQHSLYNLLANRKLFKGWFSGFRVLMLLLWMHSPMHSCASGTREYLVKKITHQLKNINLMNSWCTVINQKVMRDGEHAVS